MYFVLARTSGGGVGSRRPRNEYVGVYCLLCGFTGLFGSIARSFALMSGALRVLGARVGCALGDGAARTAIGRGGAAFSTGPLPVRGPGEAPPLGAGFGAVPAVRATTAVLVGLGLGTPLTGAGLARAMEAAVGTGLGSAGAGVAGLALGRAVGAAGLGEARATGAVEGTGDGATVGGGFNATAIGPTVGMLTGAEGTS